jgi:hypothetical protein
MAQRRRDGDHAELVEPTDVRRPVALPAMDRDVHESLRPAFTVWLVSPLLVTHQVSTAVDVQSAHLAAVASSVECPAP